MMEWVEFKNITGIHVGFEIIKQSGNICPISIINDSKQTFSYIINGNSAKTIHFKWIKSCVEIIKKENYISSGKILTFTNASCDVAIISSILVNDLKIAKYDISVGKTRYLGLIKI